VLLERGASVDVRSLVRKGWSALLYVCTIQLSLHHVACLAAPLNCCRPIARSRRTGARLSIGQLPKDTPTVTRHYWRRVLIPRLKIRCACRAPDRHLACPVIWACDLCNGSMCL
jgi:hypothetical protein